MENNTYTQNIDEAVKEKTAKTKKYYTDKKISSYASAIAVAIAIILILSTVLVSLSLAKSSPNEEETDNIESPDNTYGDTSTKGDKNSSYPFKQNITFTFPDDYSDNQTIDTSTISSKNALLLDLSNNKIIASCKSTKANVVYPASLTKVMTLICIYENLKSTNDLNEKITISEAIVTKMNEEQSSGYGFKAGEVLTVEELIYSIMLYSDGTACLTLANYVSGSEGAFVKLMNEKAKELGLQNTNFTNCTGLHNQYHYSTAQDLAAIMSYALKNTFCKNVITAQSKKLGSHFREGTCTMYNQLLIGSLKVDKPSAIQPDTCTIYGGKTGLTDEASYCLVSYAKTKSGKEYVLVTMGAESATLRNQDQIDIYNKYVK